MPKRLKTLSVLLLAISAGCAHQAPRARSVAAPTVVSGPAKPTTEPLPPEALVTLDEIQPPAELPAAPATGPGKAPLEALDLYAKAREALLENRRYSAIGLLERAIVLDPSSFELHYALGRANLGSGSSIDRAIEAFEKAAQLKPDDLDVRLQLGRQYLVRGAADKAMTHLRVGRLTPDYRTEDDLAAVDDLLLARALQQKGYDRAALDEYTLVLERLKRATPAMRGNAELVYLMNRPEVLLGQVGQLNEKLGNSEAALDAYDQAIQRDPSSFDVQARAVRLLAKLGRSKDAAARAADVVRKFRATPESMSLLRDVYRQVGEEQAVAEALSQLHTDRPEDRAILFTLADTLKTEGREQEATKLLVDAARAQRYDPELVRRLFHMYEESDRVPDAARLLVEALAARPDSLRELTPMWVELIQQSRKNRLRLPTLQKLDVSDEAQAAKQFWVSRIADLWGRDTVAKGALAQAAKARTPFAPAYRVLMNQIWAKPDVDDKQKTEEAAELAQSAQQLGNPALAAEMRGISLYHQKKPDQAIEALGEAQRLGGGSPDVTITYASALLAQGQGSKAEQMLWKLASDYPTCEDAYESLFQYYLSQKSPAQALKVLQTWLAADPTSLQAKLLQATIFFQARQSDAAETLVQQLLTEYPDNGDVLDTAQALYEQGGRLEELIARLEKTHAGDPQNREVAARLVGIYARQTKTADALRVLDQTRDAVKDDPDLLYYVSHLYGGIDQRDKAEQILQQVVKLDPTHSGAANDLGYSWADEGKNLAEAESLIKVAVQNEPDNQSFHDSHGWVQYKRGHFADALGNLQAALANTSRPDPVVLDHLGDAFYRLGRKPEALKQWRRAMTRLVEIPMTRDDLRELREQLPKKLQQAEQGGNVTVAPVASETATRPVQASKGM
jgi:tetratricopeptide (TPR) repeat protein